MPFQILSLSGGGYLGLYQIALLDKIEQSTGQSIAKSFDLIAGTSIGGITALALAAEVPAATILQGFESNGTRIFSNRPAPQGIWKHFDLMRSSFKAKYAATALRETVTEILGAETQMRHLKHPVIVPAVNLTKGAPQVFKTPHHPDFKRDPLYKVVDVALATSAAPTYFPLAMIGDELFADGGLFANSPDGTALHEAEHFFGKNKAEVSMLSIGTTTTDFAFSHTPGINLGILGWAEEQRFFRATMLSQQIYTMNVMEHRLGENYVHIDKAQGPAQQKDLALDVATPAAQRTIRSLAEASFREAVNKPKLREILRYTASSPIFYNLDGTVRAQ